MINKAMRYAETVYHNKRRQRKTKEKNKNEWKYLHTFVKNDQRIDQQSDSTWMSQSSLFLLHPVFHSSYIKSPWLTSVPKHDCLNRNLRKQRERKRPTFFSLLTRVLVVIEVRRSTQGESKACWDCG